MSAHPVSSSSMYGLLAEFETPAALVEAAEQVRDAGYVKIDAFSPFPVHGLGDAIGFKENKIPKIILCGGITGLICGFSLQYYCQVVAYPFNIGGRPYYSWVPWIPPMFEMTILFAAFSALFGMLILNGLPHPYHPVFNAPRFSRASQDAFFLVIEASDPKFDRNATRALLDGLNPREVVEVEE